MRICLKHTQFFINSKGYHKRWHVFLRNPITLARNHNMNSDGEIWGGPGRSREVLGPRAGEVLGSREFRGGDWGGPGRSRKVWFLEMHDFLNVVNFESVYFFELLAFLEFLEFQKLSGFSMTSSIVISNRHRHVEGTPVSQGVQRRRIRKNAPLNSSCCSNLSPVTTVSRGL